VDIYDEMMEASRRIAAPFPLPRFYESCAGELRASRAIYRESQLISRCRDLVLPDLVRNPSHGLDHAETVAIEAGAMARVEAARVSLQECDMGELTELTQLAGLLHDMRRGDKDHAKSGAAAAAAVLGNLQFPHEYEQHIVQAIANHEAFVTPRAIESPLGMLMSDVLYDADKFRWGPDNFTVTLWEMLRFAHAPVAAVIRRFPEGMEGIARIKGTFRSHTGRSYGPEFIDRGLAIGDNIYGFLQERFATDLK
jgi:hypothetical protein